MKHYDPTESMTPALFENLVTPAPKCPGPPGQLKATGGPTMDASGISKDLFIQFVGDGWPLDKA